MSEEADMVEVTQADRDAAADYALSQLAGMEDATVIVAAIRRGDSEEGDPLSEAFARHRLNSAPAASPVGEGEPYPADNWREQGYATPEAEIDDMARVGRDVVERIADLVKPGAQLAGWMPADSPAEIVTDLANMLHEALSTPDGYARGLEDWVAAAALYTLGAADAPPAVKSETGGSPEHASWMLHEIVNGRITASKAHRWLGYAQGVLVVAGWLTLEEAKQANKRASDEAALTPKDSTT